MGYRNEDGEIILFGPKVVYELFVELNQNSNKI